MLIFRGVNGNSIFKYVCNIYTVRQHLPKQLYQLALCDSVCVCYRSKPFCQAGGTAPRPYHVESSIGGYPWVRRDSVVIEKSTMDVLQMYFCELETYGSMVIFRQFCVCLP